MERGHVSHLLRPIERRLLRGHRADARRTHSNLTPEPRYDEIRPILWYVVRQCWRKRHVWSGTHHCIRLTGLS